MPRLNGRQSGKNNNPQYQGIKHPQPTKKRQQGKFVRRVSQTNQH